MKATLIACSLGLLALPLASQAATPANGTLMPSTPMQKLTYTVGPFTASNAAAVAAVDDGPRCSAPASPCDSYKLTVTLPAGSPLTKARVTVAWPADSMGDYDLYVYSGDKGDLDGTLLADVGQSAGSSNPEKVTFNVVAGATAVYTIKVVPYTAVPREAITGTIELLAGEPTGGDTGGGNAPSCTIPAGVRP